MTIGEFIVLICALGFGIGGASWLTSRFDLRRQNFRGERIPSMAGLVLVLAGSFFYSTEWLSQGVHVASAAVYFMVTLCFGTLGALDDVAGDRSVGGFRGHMAALHRGRFTTGLGKLIGGSVVSLVSGFLLYQPYLWNGLLAAVLIALSANALNLLDTRPGRSLFTFIVGSAIVIAVLVSLRAPSIGFLFYFALAIAVILFPMDALGRVMIGDTGSNTFGALLGVALTLVLSTQWQIAVVVALVTLNIWCEKNSLNRAIDANPVLRSLDRKIGVR